jgi:hypothetical protein
VGWGEGGGASGGDGSITLLKEDSCRI